LKFYFDESGVFLFFTCFDRGIWKLSLSFKGLVLKSPQRRFVLIFSTRHKIISLTVLLDRRFDGHNRKNSSNVKTAKKMVLVFVEGRPKQCLNDFASHDQNFQLKNSREKTHQSSSASSVLIILNFIYSPNICACPQSGILLNEQYIIAVQHRATGRGHLLAPARPPPN
jgi:hypothetical protein